jgi:hypothetical protein
MFKHLTTLLIALAFITTAQSNFNYKKDFNVILTKTKDPKDKLNYDKLVKRFKKCDTTLSNAEVLALLIGFTAKPEYKPYTHLKEEKAVYDLNAEGKYDEGLIKANEFLAAHPFSVKVIFERSFSYYKARMQDSARSFASQGYKIFNAMKYSGDGRTKQTPMFALGPEDGEDYIYKFLGSGIGEKDSMLDSDGNKLNSYEVVSKVAEPYTLYFIIQHATQTTAKLDPEDPAQKTLKKESEK